MSKFPRLRPTRIGALTLYDDRSVSGEEMEQAMACAGQAVEDAVARHHRAMETGHEAIQCDPSSGREQYIEAFAAAYAKDPNIDRADFKRRWRPNLAEWQMDIADKHARTLVVKDDGNYVRGICSLYNMIRFTDQVVPGAAAYTTMMAPTFNATAGRPDGEEQAEVIHHLLTSTMVADVNEELDVEIEEIRFPQGAAVNRWYEGTAWTLELEKLRARHDKIELRFVEGRRDEQWLYTATRKRGGRRG